MTHIRKETILLGLLYLAIFVLAAGSSYFLLSFSKIFVREKTPGGATQTSPSALNNSPHDSSFTAILLGYGGAGHEGTTLTDSIIMLRINPEKKEADLISIPRDLWVQIPTDYNNTTANKINAAYAIGLDDTTYPNKKPEFKGLAGGGALAKYVVGQVTGIKPGYFVSVDFGEFQNIIDTLGGITVNVAQTFDDNFYPITGAENDTCGISADEIATLKQKYTDFELEKQFTCRYEHLHFDKGNQAMNGETALKFVRSRHSDTWGGDFARSERQFEVLAGIEQKLISLGAIPKGGTLINQLSSMVRTDLGISQIDQLLELFGNPQNYKIITIHLTDQNVLIDSTGPGGAFILIPKDGINNFSGVQKFISSQID